MLTDKLIILSFENLENKETKEEENHLECRKTEKKKRLRETDLWKTGWFLTFNKGQELLMFDPVALHVDLESEQQGEQELVFFIQTPSCVHVHLKGHVLDDFGDPLACNWTL